VHRSDSGLLSFLVPLVNHMGDSGSDWCKSVASATQSLAIRPQHYVDNVFNSFVCGLWHVIALIGNSLTCE